SFSGGVERWDQVFDDLVGPLELSVAKQATRQGLRHLPLARLGPTIAGGSVGGLKQRRVTAGGIERPECQAIVGGDGDERRKLDPEGAHAIQVYADLGDPIPPTDTRVEPTKVRCVGELLECGMG